MATSTKAKDSAKKSSKRKPKKSAAKHIPYFQRPDGMSSEDWQIALRHQAAKEEKYAICATDGERLPGEYSVLNAKTRQEYKVVYRGARSPWNYCSCMDFKASQLGTCKHLEAVKMWIRGKAGQRVRQEIPNYTSVYLDYRSGRRVRIRIGQEHREEYVRLAAAYFDGDGELLPHAYSDIQRFICEAKKIDDGFRFYQDALDYIVERRERAEREHIIQEYDDDALDHLISAKLYPYQKEGIRFAFERGKSIIADEMGLGKTIQAIATAELLRREHLAEGVLVLCPTSLKYQWKREIERFTGAKAHVIEGSAMKRRDQYRSEEPYRIVSYNSACNDIKLWGSLRTDILIMDEVQRLKNWNTQISIAARRIQSDYSVILSGTPLENKLEELFSVMEFADQFLLGPFWRFKATCIETDELGKITGYRNLNQIGEQIRERLIRRRKKDVALQMPARQDTNLLVTITQQQMDIHEECKSQLSLLLQKWQRQHSLSEKDHLRILKLLNQMRMVCDSTYILDQKTRYDTKVGEAMNIIEEILEGDDEKVVVFSQWERMTRLVAQELEKRNIGFEYLHGGIASSQRKDLVNNFWDKCECRVFLSTDAGSTGLNLQVAATVINLDLPWNPAVLEQRIARIFRLGQKRNIQVINLVAKSTFEEQMIDKLRFKSSMFEGVLDGGADSVFADNTGKFQEMMSNLTDMLDESRTGESGDRQAVAANQEEPRLEQQEIVFPDELRDMNYATPEESQQPATASHTSNIESGKKPHESTDSAVKPASAQSPQELISQGVSFLNGLAETLKSPAATEALINNLVEEDAETGQTVLRIPVAGKQSVKDLLDIVGKLFG